MAPPFEAAEADARWAPVVLAAIGLPRPVVAGFRLQANWSHLRGSPWAIQPDSPAVSVAAVAVVVVDSDFELEIAAAADLRLPEVGQPWPPLRQSTPRRSDYSRSPVVGAPARLVPVPRWRQMRQLRPPQRRPPMELPSFRPNDDDGDDDDASGADVGAYVEHP